MEGAPNQEHLPTKAEVIEKIKAEGLSEEAIVLVQKWTEAEESHAQSGRDTVLLNVQRIEFYEAAEDVEGAFQAAQEAFENAYREGEEEICDELQARYPGIGV